jgi:hypothetical protein
MDVEREQRMTLGDKATSLLVRFLWQWQPEFGVNGLKWELSM